jgi:hypothetical protein
MASSTTQKKKSKILQKFNKFLEYVFTAGPSLSMDVLRKYEEEAIAYREHHIGKATPRKAGEESVMSELVFRRVDKTRMSKAFASGLEATLDLGEGIELALASSKDINKAAKRWKPEEWVKA